MVCLGNICRSPLAEGIMKYKIKEQGLDWKVASAGTSAWHTGEQPDSRSIATARKNGIDISKQRARQLKPHDLRQFDLVLAMDRANHRQILRQATTNEQKEKVQLIMNFAHPGNDENVPDPFWDNDGFEKVYDMLDQACDGILERLAVAKEQ